MTDKDLKILVDKAKVWASSDEGKKAMNDAHERSNKLIEYLRKAREVDWSKIHEPMTI